jgi:3',5'-nucleoside bisphosphate phosphatase
MIRTDLHMHTTASDGLHPPAELVALAQQRGLTTIAITDHDTTDGTAAARALNLSGITIIPAIELGAEDEKQYVDILGYFIDPQHFDHATPFQAWLTERREDRYHRGQRMVDKLAEIGIRISFEAVQAAADGAPITRPHVARVLVEQGYAASKQDAFDRLIGTGGPAYVARQRLTPEEAIAKLHSVGACAVLAHPARVRGFEQMVAERLVPIGLDGLELYHPDNGEKTQYAIQALALKHDLLLTGGSDYHEARDDGTITLGMYGPPHGAVEALWARAQRYRSGLS